MVPFTTTLARIDGFALEVIPGVYIFRKCGRLVRRRKVERPCGAERGVKVRVVIAAFAIYSKTPTIMMIAGAAMIFGASGQNRTDNLLITNELLCH